MYAMLITAIAVFSTASFVYIAAAHALHGRAYTLTMAFAIGLPFVIALPISTLSLHIVLYITRTLEKIENFVKFDSLTGVLARSCLLESVRQRFGEGGAFMLVDADHFKKINDEFGHDMGDEALRTIGSVLNMEVPPECSRWTHPRNSPSLLPVSADWKPNRWQLRCAGPYARTARLSQGRH